MHIFLKRYLSRKKIVKPLLFLCLVVGLLSISLYLQTNDGIHQHDISVYSESGVHLETQIADTPAKRTIGLSDHIILRKNQAMLFIFQQPGLYAFHMPDMDFPIDIFWLNSEKEIVFIKQNADPKDFPELYRPTQPALYVLETVAGFANKNDINVGDSFNWNEKTTQ